ncbi:radical SAM protein [Acidisoma sp. S159]|uniref:radical SAM protein n=1 Tax=Acidisoma sp. S159 TaxID=1747225 RepID=UPI00131D6D89|nr:radical SAM protein [Acidisoma sp. S159]
MTLRLDDGAVFLEAADLTEISRRRAAFDRIPRQAAQAAGFGLVRQRPRTLIDDKLLRSMGWSGLEYDAAACALVTPGAPPDAGDDPAALLFYDTRLLEDVSLKIELTTKCNFKCGFCYGRHVKQGTVNATDVYKLIERFANMRELELTGEGESLLLPELPDIVAFAAARGIHVRLGTNGSLLTPTLSRRLIESGLKELTVSLETLDPERFTEIRARGNLKGILNSLSIFIATKRELGRDVKVSLWMTILKESLNQIEDVEALALSMGLDSVEYQTLNTMDQYSQYYSQEFLRNVLTKKDLAAFRVEAGPVLRRVIDSLLQEKSSKRCLAPTEMIRVGWQGHVTPCCNLQTPYVESLGNLYQQSWLDISKSERYRLFRFATLHGVILNPCRSCPAIAAPHFEFDRA